MDMAHKRAALVGCGIQSEFKACGINAEIAHLLLSCVFRHTFREAKSVDQSGQKFLVLLERPLSRDKGPAIDEAVFRHAVGGRQTSL